MLYLDYSIIDHCQVTQDFNYDHYFPNFKDGSFEAIIKLCTSDCDGFTLTYHHPINISAKARALLSPHCMGKIITTQWFAYETTPANPLTVYLYPVNQTTKRLLGDYSKRYASHRQDLVDLCFFKDGQLVFGSVYHERIFHAYPPTDHFRQELLTITRYWQSCENGKPLHLADYTITPMTP